jgi:hypothetical protein
MSDQTTFQVDGFTVDGFALSDVTFWAYYYTQDMAEYHEAGNTWRVPKNPNISVTLKVDTTKENAEDLAYIQHQEDRDQLVLVSMNRGRTFWAWCLVQTYCVLGQMTLSFSSVGEIYSNGSTPVTTRASDLAEKTKCSCDLDTIMGHGCRCGGS